ncbi:MAG: hypothetical protein IIA14_16765 [SAR324 cluster bacterium]|nr:hypothetical protein [SAR324 cluster bacterium]
MGSQEGLILAIKLVFAFAAVVLLVAVVVIPIMRTLRTKPDILDLTFSIPEEEEQEIELPKGDEKPDTLTMVEKARSNPRETAALISRWIREKR